MNRSDPSASKPDAQMRADASQPIPPTHPLRSQERLSRCSGPKQREIPRNFSFCLKDLVPSRDLAEAINGEQHSRQQVYPGQEDSLTHI